MKLIYQENSLLRVIPQGAEVPEEYRSDPAMKLVDTEGDPSYTVVDGCLLRWSGERTTLMWFPEDREVLFVPEGVRHIYGGPACTWDNPNLKAVYLPEGVRVLGYSTFAGCSALRLVSLPATMEFVGADAFADCTALQAVILHSPVTSFEYVKDEPDEEDCDAFEGVEGAMVFAGANPWMDPYLDRHRFVRRPLAEAAVLEARDRGPEESREADQREHLLSLTDIGVLGLSPRPCNCLRGQGVDTLRALLDRSGEELLALRSMTPACVAEVREKLGERGLALRDE